MWKKLSTTALFSTFAMFQTCDFQQAIVCVPVKEYSAATQKRAAEEFAEIKLKYPTTTQLIADYGSMRSAARACQSGRTS